MKYRMDANGLWDSYATGRDILDGLEFDPEKNELRVWSREPGRHIGKGGHRIRENEIRLAPYGVKRIRIITDRPWPHGYGVKLVILGPDGPIKYGLRFGPGLASVGWLEPITGRTPSEEADLARVCRLLALKKFGMITAEEKTELESLPIPESLRG